MKKRNGVLVFAIVLAFFSSSVLAAGGLPTFDITAMLNWITEFATNTEDKIKEKIVWAEDMKTAIEHYKEIQNYWEQLKGIGNKFSFDGLWKGLELAGKMQQDTHRVVQDAKDAGKGFESGLEETWSDIESISSGRFFDDAEAGLAEAYSKQNPEERFGGIMQMVENEMKLCDQGMKDVDDEIKQYGEVELPYWQTIYENMYESKTFYEIQSNKTPYAIKKEKQESPFVGRDDIEVYVKEIDDELVRLDESKSVSETASAIDIGKYLNKEAYNESAVIKVCLYNTNAAKTDTERQQWETIRFAAEESRGTFNEQSEEIEETLDDAQRHIDECNATLDKLAESRRVIEEKKILLQNDYNLAKNRLDRYRSKKN